MTSPDLSAAASALELADAVVRRAFAHLAADGSVETDQVVAYDLAHAAAAVGPGRNLLDYGERGDVEAALTCAFAADAVHDAATKVFGREGVWGVEPGALDAVREFCATFRAPEFLASVADQGEGPRHLDDD